MSKVPSPDKNKSQQSLIYTYIGVLGLVIIIRIIDVIGLAAFENFNPILLLVAIAFGLIIPGLGIYGALTARVETYRTVGILLLLGVFRSFRAGENMLDPSVFLFLIPTALAIGLAFYIPTKFKTGFSKKVNKEEVSGKVKTTLKYSFETSRTSDNDLLDSGL